MATKEELTQLFQDYDSNNIPLEEISNQLKYILIDLRQSNAVSGEKIEDFRELSTSLETNIKRYEIAKRHKRRNIPLTNEDLTAEDGLKSIIEEIRDTLKVHPSDYTKTQTLITAKPEKSGEDEVEKELLKLIFERGTAATKRNILTIGETWAIGGGWTLTAQSIDAKTSPRQAWLILSNDGVKKKDMIVVEGKIYSYVDAGETGTFLFATYVDTVFAGATADFVVLISAELKTKDDKVDTELMKLIIEHGTTSRPEKSGDDEIEKELIKLIFEETDATKKKLLFVGEETWDIGDGWALTAQVVDAKTSPRQAWLTLSKYGFKKEDMIVVEDKIYTYVDKRIANKTSVPLFAAYVDTVFAGATADFVVLISAEPNKLKEEKVREELNRLIIEHGTPATKRNILTIGETWNIGGGWALTAQAVDAKTSPRKALLTLSKDGTKKEDIVVVAGKLYKYVESIAGGTDDVKFEIFVDAVFAGYTSDLVQFSIRKKKR